MDAKTDLNQAWALTGRQPRIAVIGAGMSGICAKVLLEQAGYTDLTIYEKGPEVGGTWRENRYPGLSCDVPCPWYSFRFALRHDWTYRYAYGPELQDYMEQVSRDFGVYEKVKFNTPVESLTYQGPTWLLKTENGQEEVYDIVISATGILHYWQMPNIPGRESFKGDSWHSADWPDGYDLKGKRVAVIGTGSTAAQIIGAITPEVGEMVCFQRTPQWMIPMKQKEYSGFKKWMLKTFPFLKKWRYELYKYLLINSISKGTVGYEKVHAKMEQSAIDNLHEHVKDPELRKKLTPDYRALCKRIIVCTDFYKGIVQDHAHLVTEPIEEINESGIKAGGKQWELDAIVYATGFDASKFILPVKVTGEGDRDLETIWDGSPRAYRGVGMPGFPNFFFLEGPTSPIGNFSLINISEAQTDHIVQMLDKMKAERLAAVVPTEEAFRSYNEEMMAKIPDTIWSSGGCDSWYFDKSGVPNLYPFMPTKYIKEMEAEPLYQDYELRPAANYSES